jgi:hypothetical protein
MGRDHGGGAQLAPRQPARHPDPLYQLVAAFALLLAAAIGLGQASFRPTALAWGNLAFQTLAV